ncbi:MAG: SseB family protein [Oscillospiraceae bacterium]|nr:SseB family protein [Oscillospiraceae bacterium]
MEQKISRKDLDSGNLLRFLKHRFLTQQNRQTLMPVLSCLRDSEVIVPVQVNVSDADRARILNAAKGESVDTIDPVSFKPDLLQSEDGTFLPVFSSADQIDPEYAKNFALLTVPAVQCIRTALDMKDVSGLVIDAFTEAMLVPKESAEIILKMKSHLEPDQA